MSFHSIHNRLYRTHKVLDVWKTCLPLVEGSLRALSTHPTHKITDVAFTNQEKALVLHAGKEISTNVDYVWLRHSCRCPLCYNKHTFQNEIPIGNLINRSIAKNVSIGQGSKTLNVKWCDDHESTYDIWQLLANSLEKDHKHTKTVQHLWDNNFLEANWPRVSYQEVMLPDDQGVSSVLRNILQYGFCFVEKAIPEDGQYMQITQQVIEKVAFVQKTFWGEMWQVLLDKDKADTSYSNVNIPPHNDGTYMYDPPGVVVFHCTKRAATGGETLLLDSFKLAEDLAQEDPEVYRILSSIPLEAEFRDHGEGVKGKWRYHNRDVIFKHDILTGKIVQTRYNPLDMLPITTVAQSDVRRVYEALEKVFLMANDPRYAIRLMLNPGTVLFVDNYRLFHAREAFSGERVLCGSYIGRADWLSKARVVGLL